MIGETVSHYRLLYRLGGGSMGVVYEAEDTRLGRRVAVKFLATELGESVEAAERFRREARAASKLNHPHICTVHDIGEEDGRPFIVMERLQGSSLKQLIAAGPLGIQRVLEIGEQVADALAAAHAENIIHRDIKPANIFVDQRGQAKLLDFGLAKVALEGPSNGSQAPTELFDPELTSSGSAVGTAAYMSPEQARGEPLDARTDVFSLGVVLYEAASGVRPFPGRSIAELFTGILSRTPDPPSKSNPEVPPELDRIILRALEKQPDLRAQSAAEMRAALKRQLRDSSSASVPPASAEPEATPPAAASRRWKIAAASLLALLVVAVVAWRAGVAERPDGPPAAAVSEAGGAGERSRAGPPTLAVLPLDNLTGNGSLDWFGLGVAQLITDNLSQSRLVRVATMDRTRSLAGLQGQQPAGEATAEGLDYVVSGEILAGPGGLTISARLLATREGLTVASRRLDALSEEQLMGAADELSAAIRRGLGIPPEEVVDVFAADFASANLEAYEAYLRGLQAQWDFHLEVAEAAFLEALSIAPDFTMARYRLAWVYAGASQTDQALHHVRKALAEAAGSPDREQRYLRAAEAYFSRRYEPAISEYRELVATYPYEIEARYLLAQLLEKTGRHEEQIHQARILADLEPESPSAHALLGRAHAAVEDYGNAVLEFQKYVALAPDSANGYDNLGDAYRALGELDLAAAEYSRALAADPSFHLSAINLALVEFLRGRWVEAADRFRAIVDDRAATPRHRIRAGFELAWILRSAARPRQAADVLTGLEAPIRQERVRESMALAESGLWWAELGEVRRGRKMIDRAIRISPASPTRYLFARARLELLEGNLEAVRRTAARIMESQPPPGNPDLKAQKAAAYLEGRCKLAAGDVAGALVDLTRSLTLEGYEYALYRLGLARALLAAGRLPEALTAARQAAEDRDPADPRIDLEIERLRARLVLAEVHAALGRPQQAAEIAGSVLARWADAEPDVADAEWAWRLGSLPGTQQGATRRDQGGGSSRDP